MYGFFEDSIILIYRPVCLKKRKHIAWVINKKEGLKSLNTKYYIGKSSFKLEIYILLIIFQQYL
jgi:hypothetical protein